MRYATFLYGEDFHYLDHLAPLSALLKIPFVTTEETIYEMASSHYPDVKPLYFDALEVTHALLQDFDAIIYSFTAKHFHNFFSFAQDRSGKKLKTIWCPHGNSDKDNLGSLMDEPKILIYGKKMEVILKQKNVHSPSFTVGNYRLTYYQKNKGFYEKILQKLLSSLPSENPTYLYAPTWEDYENNSSWKDFFPYLLKTLPDSVNLIIKPHPNTWMKNPFEIERIFYPYETKKNILLLTDFMPVYPLLEKIDAYIGDYSSIGYDFLFFNKPMFFITDKKSPMSSCGHHLEKNFSFHLMEEKRKEDSLFTPYRKKLYDYTFDNVALCPQSLQQFPV